MNFSIEIIVAEIAEAFKQLKFFRANENVVLLTFWNVCRLDVVEHMIEYV